MYPNQLTRANLTEKVKCLEAVNVYGVIPPMLFNKISKNKLKAQWVCPGVLTGWKLSLNSLANDVSNLNHKNRIPGFEIQ